MMCGDLTFRLILPEELRFSFKLETRSGNKTFQLVLLREITYTFLYDNLNNKTFLIKLPDEIYNTFLYSNENNKTFEFSCLPGVEYIYFITSDGEYFKVIGNKLLTVQKPI